MVARYFRVLADDEQSLSAGKHHYRQRPSRELPFGPEPTSRNRLLRSSAPSARMQSIACSKHRGHTTFSRFNTNVSP